MTENLCALCGRPQPDTAVACKPCADRIGRQLHAIAELVPDARAVAARQTRRGAPVRDSGFERPLPFDTKAAAKLDAAQNALTTWVRHIAEERGLDVPAGADPLLTAARWLVDQVEWCRHRDEVSEVAQDASACLRVLNGIVEPPREKRYAGPCNTRDDDGEVCGTDLYAKAGADVAVCRACGWEYDVDAQQAWMREQVRDRLARPVEIAGILLRLGFEVGYSTVARYAAKEQITAVAYDLEGRALYRIGDVMDLRMTAPASR